jgi:hypothetical protein
MNISDLHNKIQAVAPIDGVSVGIVSDKSTWRINFQPAATSLQRAAAQTVIDNYDPIAVDAAVVQRATDFNSSPETVDLIARARTATNAQIDTWLTNNVTNLVQARTVLGAIIKLLIAKGII